MKYVLVYKTYFADFIAKCEINRLDIFAGLFALELAATMLQRPIQQHCAAKQDVMKVYKEIIFPRISLSWENIEPFDVVWIPQRLTKISPTFTHLVPAVCKLKGPLKNICRVLWLTCFGQVYIHACTNPQQRAYDRM